MRAVPTNYTIAQYCKDMKDKDIIVNYQYQRSHQVWPEAARSFLIETILLDYRVPKLYLYQKTDLKSRKTHMEIVDGQQRSRAILDFYNDKLKLPKSSDEPEFAGKLYSELPEEYQRRFLDYSISADIFVSATDEEIRETFRRINSYMVPLNYEETRHAVYQGEFKWFIYRLSKTYEKNLYDMRVFTETNFIRMLDTKLYSEIIHAILYGINLIVAKELDALYDELDKSFPEEKEIEKRFEETMDFLLDLKEIHSTSLMKPYNFYCLFLAVSHIKMPIRVDRKIPGKGGRKDPPKKWQIPDFVSIYEPPRHYEYNRGIVVTNLSALAEAVEVAKDRDLEDYEGRFDEFVKATQKGTNSRANRTTRFKWFCRALQPEQL